MANVTALVFAIAVGLATAEILAYAPRISRWLVNRAVRKLPEADRDRYREEWLAHADELPGHLTKLLHALDCELRGAIRIAKLRAGPSASESAVRRIIRELTRAYLFVLLTPRFVPTHVRFAIRRQFWKCKLAWAVEKSVVNNFVHHSVTLGEKPEQIETAIHAHAEKVGRILNDLKEKLERNAEKRLHAAHVGEESNR